MAECNSPLIICRLANKNGEILNPYAPNAISFTRLCSSEKWAEGRSGSSFITLLISGYVVIYVDGRDMSPPVPFRMTKHFNIFTPDDTFLEFQVREFECTAVPIMANHS